jgi:hypothetical protein
MRAKRRIPETARLKPDELLRHFAESLDREMGLGAEARASVSIGAFLRDLGVRTARFDWELSGRRVNIQERLRGVPATDLARRRAAAISISPRLLTPNNGHEAGRGSAVLPSPFEGGVFDGFERPPWSAPVDDLGLVESIDRLGQGVVVVVADAAHRWFDPGIGEALGVFDRDVMAAAVAVMDQATTMDRPTIMDGLLQVWGREVLQIAAKYPPQQDQAA